MSGVCFARSPGVRVPASTICKQDTSGRVMKQKPRAGMDTLAARSPILGCFVGSFVVPSYQTSNIIL